jgi:hypothetical protein
MVGTLRIFGTQSQVNGILLALCGDPNPFDSATGFLKGLGFDDGDPIAVSGSFSNTGGATVFCLTGAQAA